MTAEVLSLHEPLLLMLGWQRMLDALRTARQCIELARADNPSAEFDTALAEIDAAIRLAVEGS